MMTAWVFILGVGSMLAMLCLGFAAGRCRCPVCGAHFRMEPEREKQVRFGWVPCPRCGTPVEVER